MARPFREFLEGLPPERRTRIEAAGREMIAEERCRREVRESLARSQVQGDRPEVRPARPGPSAEAKPTGNH